MRDTKLDTLKGFAILLVVFGHADQTNILNYNENIIFRIIYSFHMPFFFFLSGYILYDRIRLPLHTWVKGKGERLLIPFIAWGWVYYFVKYQNIELGKYFTDLFLNPGLGLWFLLILFILSCILGAVFLTGEKLINVKLLGLWGAIQFIPYVSLTLFLIKWHFLFFITGYIFKKYETELEPKLKHLFYLLAALFPFLSWNWYYGYEPSTAMTIYRYITAFSGISLCWIGAPLLENIGKKTLSCLGTKTLEIYAIHPLFLISYGEGAGAVFFTFFISLGCSILIGTLLRKSKVLGAVFLGRNKY